MVPGVCLQWQPCVNHLQEVDMGLYACTVFAWSVDSQGDYVKTAESTSSPATIRWDTKRKEALFIKKNLVVMSSTYKPHRLWSEEKYFEDSLCTWGNQYLVGSFTATSPTTQGCVGVNEVLWEEIRKHNEPLTHIYD